MSDLLGSLGAAARALDAQRFGLDVVGQNIANVNTPGYTRREVELSAIPPVDRLSAGGGVSIVGARAIRDLLLDRRLREESPAEQKEAAIADSLGIVEVAVGRPGQSIDAALTAFFDAFASLAQDPTGATSRQGVVLQGQSLSSAFGDMADRLSAAQRDTDTRLRAAVEEVNDLAARLGSLNESIGSIGASSGETEHLKDSLNETLKTLAELIDIRTVEEADGKVTVTYGQGRPLVVGADVYSIDVTSEAPNGFAGLRSGGTLVTTEIASGRIGGLLQVRDTLLPDYQTRLDELAYAVVDEVNTLHVAGFDLNGAAGGVFFTALGSSAGAASAMTVSPAIAADFSKVAAASTTEAGDNQTATAIAALRDSRVMNGGLATFTDSWAALVYRVGRDAQTAQRERQSRADIVQQIEALRDSVSGVSLDEEAMRLLRFQRAYEANARFFQTVNEAMKTLLQMMGS